MQNEVTTEGNLLDEKGHLIECGYATKLIKKYLNILFIMSIHHHQR